MIVRPGRLFSASLFLMLLLLSACQGGSNDVVSMLTVEELHFSKEQDSSRIVTGFVRNESEEMARGVVVQVDLVDDRNQVLQKVQIDVDPIPPAERVSFRKVLDTDRPIHGVRASQIIVF